MPMSTTVEGLAAGIATLYDSTRICAGLAHTVPSALVGHPRLSA